MKPRPRTPPPDDSSPLDDATWLYSFADLMTQLLIFAVLMITAMGVKPLKTAPDAAAPPPPSPLTALQQEVERMAKQSGLGDALTVDRSANRLTIRMKSAILFGEAQDRLTRDAERVLDELTPILVRTKNNLRVDGHTDDVGINTAAFPSNWELSAARAISVARYLEARGVASARFSVAGFGEFHPMVPNLNASSRALNRRVEIVVLGE